MVIHSYWKHNLDIMLYAVGHEEECLHTFYVFFAYTIRYDVYYEIKHIFNTPFIFPEIKFMLHIIDGITLRRLNIERMK